MMAIVQRTRDIMWVSNKKKEDKYPVPKTYFKYLAADVSISLQFLYINLCTSHISDKQNAY